MQVDFLEMVSDRGSGISTVNERFPCCLSFTIIYLVLLTLDGKIFDILAQFFSIYSALHIKHCHTETQKLSAITQLVFEFFLLSCHGVSVALF